MRERMGSSPICRTSAGAGFALLRRFSFGVWGERLPPKSRRRAGPYRPRRHFFVPARWKTARFHILCALCAASSPLPARPGNALPPDEERRFVLSRQRGAEEAAPADGGFLPPPLV